MPPLIEHDAILIACVFMSFVIAFVVKLPVLTLMSMPIIALITVTLQSGYGFPYLNIVLILVALSMMVVTIGTLRE